MASIRPLAPDIDLGRRVYHRSDHTKPAGVVVGLLFRPREVMLVRWLDGSATFEAPTHIRNTVDPMHGPAAMAVAEQIRRRIERGILPVTMPAKTVSIEVTQWQPCDGCDELIGPRHIAWALEYAAPPRVIRLHRACHALWTVECRRLAPGRLASTGRRASSLRSGVARCALCRQPIAARQNLLFRADGQVEHVRCPVTARKPLARRAPTAVAELICLACGKPIEPPQSLVREGDTLLHASCFVDRARPIAGGGTLPAWTLIGDEHIGRLLGTTRTGHQDFMAACAEVRRATATLVIRARRAVAESRAARHRSAAIA
jgi:hypothetical protein